MGLRNIELSRKEIVLIDIDTVIRSGRPKGDGKRGKNWFLYPGWITIKGPYKEANWLLTSPRRYAAQIVIQLNIPDPWISFTGRNV